MLQTADVVILGAGPGGLSAATALALRGLDVTVVSNGHLMGYGIEGAFKSKAEFEIARLYANTALRRDLFTMQPAPNFGAVKGAIEHTAKHLSSGIKTRLQRLGIKLLKGVGQFVDPRTVVVGDDIVRAENIVIATGSVPRVFPGVTVDARRVLTSDEIVRLTALPESLLILGAGVIGCEFASIFNELGAKVLLVDTQARILSSEDEDLSGFLASEFSQRGIEVIPSCRFEKLQVGEKGVSTILSDGQRVQTESVLLAVGRNPSTSALNLDGAGVKVDERGYVQTDQDMRTNVPHIYAVGDVGLRNTPTDIALVHVAQAEGRRAAYSILGQPFTQNMDHVPYIIFTVPMIAGAGLSENVARGRHGKIRVGKYPYGRNHRAHALFAPVGFVKLIVGPEGDDSILGVRAIGRDADALVAAASTMIDQALPYTYILDSILPHPSLMECLQGAAHIVAGNALSYEEGEEFHFANLVHDISG
mgnify:FL=1